MLLLSDSDVSNILLNLPPYQCQRLLHSLEGILRSYSTEKLSQEPKDLHQPHRSSLVNKHDDTTLVMPSSDTTNTAVKVVTLPCDGVATGAILLMEASGRVAGGMFASLFFSRPHKLKTSQSSTEAGLDCTSLRRTQLPLYAPIIQE
jgi:ornithine cyclodeaminase